VLKAGCSLHDELSFSRQHWVVGVHGLLDGGIPRRSTPNQPGKDTLVGNAALYLREEAIFIYLGRSHTVQARDRPTGRPLGMMK